MATGRITLLFTLAFFSLQAADHAGHNLPGHPVKNAPAKRANYPTIPIEQDGPTAVIPFCTSFPFQGAINIIGKKMHSALGAYLRGNRHFLHQNDPSKKFILKHVGNVSAIGEKYVTMFKKLQKASPIFLSFLETSTFLSIEKLIHQKKALLLFPLNRVREIRPKPYENVIYFRPSITKELDALMHYALVKHSKTNVAIIYDASTWGVAVKDIFINKLKRYPHAQLVAQASYPHGTVEVKKALDVITPTMPNVVFCFTHSRPAYTFIRHAFDRGLNNTMFIGFSGIRSIQKILHKIKGIDLVVSTVVPSPNHHRNLAIIKEYKAKMKQFLSFRSDSLFYLESFINASLLEHCLNNITGSITIEKIITEISSWRNKNFKGLQLNFNPQDRSLSSKVWISPGVGKPWIAYNGDEKS